MTSHGRMTVGGRVTLSVVITLCVFLCSSSFVESKPTAPTCTSHAGNPDFAIQGKPPQKNRGLTFCQQYERNTCCDRGTTDSVRRVVAHMQANGFSSRCRDAWTSLECSVCDPRAGVVPVTPVCQIQCDSVYAKCKDEHFAEDSLGHMVPCRASDTICAKLSDWMAAGTVEGEGTSLGTQMCEAAGYRVVTAGEAKANGGWCFDENDVSGLGTSSSSSTSKSSKSKSKAKDKKKKGGSDSDAEEYAKLQGWMSRIYVLIGLGAVARLSYKIWDQRRKDSGSGAARHAARLAAENRARREKFDNQAKML